MTTEPNAAPLNSLSAKLAELGAIDPAHCPARTESNPPPDSSFIAPAHYPEAGKMPVIAGIQWESKKYGIEAWHSPEGKRNRAGKTYIGRIGKRQLAAWSALAPADARAAVIAWIAEKRAAKGIE